MTDALTLKSITAYRKLNTDDYVDIDATQYEVGDVFVGVDQNQFSQEFQLAYTGDRLNAVAGLYYLKEHIKSHQEAYGDDLLGASACCVQPFTFLRTVDDDLTTKSYAAYANASYEIVPTVRLSAGLRYTQGNQGLFPDHVDLLRASPLLERRTFVFDRRRTIGTTGRRWRASTGR